MSAQLSALRAFLGKASSFWAIGEVDMIGGCEVDYELAESGMDPLDRPGAVQEPKSAKAARSYMEIPWDKERWDVGLPEEVAQMTLALCMPAMRWVNGGDARGSRP